jgi:hypothetical protein
VFSDIFTERVNADESLLSSFPKTCGNHHHFLTTSRWQTTLDSRAKIFATKMKTNATKMLPASFLK